MNRSSRHHDATIAECQQWIAYHYAHGRPLRPAGAAVGDEDPASFRRLLKRDTGIAPGRCRRFGAPRGGMSRDRREGL